MKVRGGRGLESARLLSADEIIATVEASGLRGRAAARASRPAASGAPVRDYCSNFERTSVVVNAAEGEPGTFKDRTILRNDPYQVLEGRADRRRVRSTPIRSSSRPSMRSPGRSSACRVAIDEVKGAGWSDGDRESRSTRDRTSTCTAKRPRCWRRSTVATPFPASRRPTGEVCARSSSRPAISNLVVVSRRTSRWRGPTPTTTAPPDPGRQRRDARQRRADPREGRGVVPHRGNPRVAGDDRLHRDRLDAAQRCRRGHHGYAAPRGDRSDRRRAAPRSSASARCFPVSRARSSRAARSTPP